MAEPSKQADRAADAANGALPPTLRNAELKAALLLVLMLVLLVGTAVYLMYARGAFDATQRLVLRADDSEGVGVGMDVTFAGFPVGRVRRIELGPDGKARILVDLSQKEAHWLRTTSVFTLEKGLVGGARLRAFTGLPEDPPLPEGAQRDLLVGDMAGEVPKLLNATHELLQNLNNLTAAESALNASLQNVQGMTARLNGPDGAMGLLAGDDQHARQLLQNANALIVKAGSLVGNADQQVFGKQGVLKDTQAAVVQMNGLLIDARASLKKMDLVLAEAQAVGANARVATQDLGALRADVDANLRRVEQLINEINRKWPFKRDTEIKLP